MRTGRRPLRVFLSHTSDLGRVPPGYPFAAAAVDAIVRAGHAVEDMDHWSADSRSPEQKCRETVEECDVYVVVLGSRYGSPVPGSPDLSYTEMEFDTARRAGTRILAFLLDGDATVTGADPRQQAFRDRVRESGSTTVTAYDPHELHALVLQALLELPGGERGWFVPQRNPLFVGRADALRRLRTTLCAGGRATCVVHGMGGIGKTAVALEYAYRYADHYDLVWWIPSADPAAVPASLASCAVVLGLAEPGVDVDVAVALLRTYLHDHDRWLLCFDDVEDPIALREHLPVGPGHVLLTSRSPDWSGVADTVGLGLLDGPDAVTLLRERVPALSDDDAGRVADALDHLPLALGQAGAYLARTGRSVGEYLGHLRDRVGAIMARGEVLDHGVSFAASWELALDRLADEQPAALQLMAVCAHLAPEPVPFDLFADQPGLLPEPAATAVADPLEFDDLVGLLRARALAGVDVGRRTLELHRLVQALLRDRLAGHDEPTSPRPAETAAALLRSGVPADPWSAPDTWPSWDLLLPHVLAVTTGAHAPADVDPNRTCWLLDRAATFLYVRGQARRALSLFERVRAMQRDRLGEDHPTTLQATSAVAVALAAVGEHERARRLQEDTLARRRDVHGDDDLRTLASAADLAITLAALGRLQQAIALHEEAYAGRRGRLGPDHVDTLTAAHNLADTLAALGRVEQAAALQEDTTARRRRILGVDHPDTLRSANNLAVSLAALGRPGRAVQLHEDTRARLRRVLGDDHPSTLTSATDLADTLTALGRHREALALHDDTLERRGRILGDDHPDTVTSFEGVAAARAAIEDGQDGGAMPAADVCGPLTAPDTPPREGTMSTSHEVTPADTAAALGSGDVDVLGTPRLVAWLEAATVEAAAPHLGPGQTSVGTAVRIRHRRPTPVGGTVTVEVSLRGAPDGGRLGFTVSAHDGDGTLVGDGEIDRVVVEREGFGQG